MAAVRILSIHLESRCLKVPPVRPDIVHCKRNANPTALPESRMLLTTIQFAIPRSDSLAVLLVGVYKNISEIFNAVRRFISASEMATIRDAPCTLPNLAVQKS